MAESGTSVFTGTEEEMKGMPGRHTHVMKVCKKTVDPNQECSTWQSNVHLSVGHALTMDL